jgi:hypothetical protein
MFLVHILAFLSAYLHAYFEVFMCITIRSLELITNEQFVITQFDCISKTAQLIELFEI